MQTSGRFACRLRASTPPGKSLVLNRALRDHVNSVSGASCATSNTLAVQMEIPFWAAAKRATFGGILRGLLVVLCGMALSATVLAQGVLRISAIPDESPTELQRKFSKVAAHLEKETGMKVQYTAVTDYAAVGG